MTTTGTPCPICDHPMVTVQHDYHHWQTTALGATCHTIALSHSECPACGSYFTMPDQSRANKRAILAVMAAFPTVLMP